jgi:hypothetical protein
MGLFDVLRCLAGNNGGSGLTMLHRSKLCCLAVTWLVLTGSAAIAQSGSPLMGRPSQLVEGGVGLRPAPQALALSGTQARRQHLGPTGKPCVVLSGEAQSQTVNPHIFEHIIAANNSCSQIISLFVCYYGSERCVPMTVPSYSRKIAVLGIEPAANTFRFEYWERFP